MEYNEYAPVATGWMPPEGVGRNVTTGVIVGIAFGDVTTKRVSVNITQYLKCVTQGHACLPTSRHHTSPM